MGVYSEKHLAFGGGNEYVDFGNVFDKTNTDAWTWSGWVRTTTNAGMVLASKMGNAPNFTGWSITHNFGALRVYLINTWTTSCIEVYTNLLYWMYGGAWLHVCVTVDGSSSAAGIKVYVNGVEQTLTTAYDNLVSSISNSANMCLGGREYYYTGDMDEVTMWSTDLDEAGVLELFNGGVPFDPSTHSDAAYLDGHWRMGDGDTYPTITDSVGSNDGTMTNMESGDIADGGPVTDGVRLDDDWPWANGGARETTIYEADRALLQIGEIVDSSPPAFTGLQSVEAVDGFSARLHFNSASDATTEKDDLWYDVSWGYSPGHTFSTRFVARGSDVLPMGWESLPDPIACELVVDDLRPGRTYYFKVRARDEAGNRDDNDEEHGVTLPAADAHLPVVDNISPAPGSQIAATQEVRFDVTDTPEPGFPSGFTRIIVHVYYANTGAVEVAHTGDGFTGPYAAQSTRTAIAGGFRYNLNRTGGWQGHPTFYVYAIDKEGNESGPVTV